MNCLHWTSAATKEQQQKTTLGYRMFRCAACRHTFNERTGSPCTLREYPTDLVLLVVLWRLRYKLSLRDVAEMFLEQGFVFTHEAVRSGLASALCSAHSRSVVSQATRASRPILGR